MRLLHELNANGFVLLPAQVEAGEVAVLGDAVGTAAGPGVRALLRTVPQVKGFAERFGKDVVSPAVGRKVWPVRAILFDKTPVSNWYVTWHQDRTIPVWKRVEVDGFRAWTEKEGVVHVQPPAEVLEGMVAACVALDQCGIANGAIKFIAGSHRYGIMDDTTIAEWRDSRESAAVACEIGDVILMRPLVLHASSKAEDATSRRVLHVEYATAQLPGGLEWAAC